MPADEVGNGEAVREMVLRVMSLIGAAEGQKWTTTTVLVEWWKDRAVQERDKGTLLQ